MGKSDKPAEHKVNDERDAEQVLDDVGVHSIRQIRRADGARRHHIAETEAAQQLNLNATGSPDQVAANMAALERARNELFARTYEVHQLIAEATRLGGRMHDGHGPISATMRRLFRRRAEDADGVVQALTSYRDELGTVTAAIDRTLAAYTQSEQTSVGSLNAAADSAGGVNG